MLPRSVAPSGLFLACLVVLLALTPAQSDEPLSEPTQTRDEGRPRLAVLVAFDQFRGDYPARWKDLYVKGGFRRLMTDGAWFQNCHYPYAATLTAVGHASMVTGATPRTHGIIANSWYDRITGTELNVVRSDRHRLVPGPGSPTPGAAPVRLRAPTLGDSLHRATKGKGKMVSLSIKDRPAILLAALLRGQLCFWFNIATGQFVTSTYYADTLPGWVREFNRRGDAARQFGKEWTKLRSDLDYAAYSGPDNVAAEGAGYAQGRAFPHPLTGGKEKLGREYYEAWANSPYGNEVLLSLAKAAIEGEQLGQDDVPDLLTLSFSSNDMVGHCWGPDSQEVLDITLRSDLLMKDLLDYLDRRVGRGRYVVAVCADHGVCPIPEVARQQGKDAGRVSPATVTTRATAFLNETFSKPGEVLPWVEAASGPQIYLNRGVVKFKQLDQAKVEEALATWLAKQPGIQAAYTRTRLTRGPLKDDPVGEMVRQSFDPPSSGDVVAVLRPYHLLTNPIGPGKQEAYRTTHGTVHPYDTHVPLLVYGAGVRPGVRTDRVTPLAVGPILARALGIDPPEQAEVPVPPGLFK
ncbi:MAG: alkaline phosphatase family protein [Gemmataceae bacterium]|nr:alkaline phosphatase family protein [Gemmataceae bacterium]